METPNEPVSFAKLALQKVKESKPQATLRLSDLIAGTLPLDGMQSVPRPRYLIKHLIVEGTSNIFMGRDGTYKSALVLSMCISVSGGIDWFGHKVRQRNVVYFASEGYSHFKDRFHVWQIQNDMEGVGSNVNVYHGVPNLHDITEADLSVLGEYLMYYDAELFVVDTLNRAASDADANTSAMNKVRESLDYLRWYGKDASSDVPRTSIVIAHTNKDDTSARGFSGIQDDADGVIHVKRAKPDMPYVNLRVAKMKDGDRTDPMYFEGMRIVTGKDEDGDDESSFVMQLVDEETVLKAAGRRDSGKGQFLTGLTQGLTAERDDIILRSMESGKSYKRIDVVNESGLPSKTAYRAINDLIKRGAIKLDGNLIEKANDASES